ncbi:MAG: L-lactate dehydrogenase [Clostridia bacterium]|nr:L-lactate dehydrogenase [Clostridia bacterium]
MINKQKCAIIGCGFVGSTIAYTLMDHGLFSEMVLIDSNPQKAVGEAMDLNHGLPFIGPMKIYAGDYSDLHDAHIIVIAAGTSQKSGETRIELVHRNVEIFKSIIPQITAVNNECMLLVVSNPVDVLTYAALKLSGFESRRVIGSGTVLDTGRLKYLVGEHLGVDSRNVHSFIIGEHGDSELAVWSSANVSGVDLDDYCRITGKQCDAHILEDMYEQVRDSAYKIIEGKGATYYAIGQATLRIIRSIVKDQRSVLPVSCLVDGHYGLSGVCMGLPAVIGAEGVGDLLEIPLNADEERRLKTSANVLKNVIDSVSDILAPAVV